MNIVDNSHGNLFSSIHSGTHTCFFHSYHRMYTYICGAGGEVLGGGGGGHMENERFFPTTSKYEMYGFVQSRDTRVRKFLQTPYNQKMGVYERNFAKMATKKAWKLDRTRERTAVQPLNRTTKQPPPKKKISQNRPRFLLCFTNKNAIF